MIPVAVDARMIRHSGIGTYLRGILGVMTQDARLDLTLFGDLSKIADYQARKILADYPIYSLREQICFPALLKKHGVNLLHVPHYNVPLGYRGCLVVTIHDLTHLRVPPSRLAYLYARTVLEAATRKARVILTTSQNTRKDLLEIIGAKDEKIRVVHNGVDEIPDESLPASVSNQRDYLLYVGNIMPFKNVTTLVEAFLSARKKLPDLRLICAGRDFMPVWTRLYKDRPELRFLGEVSQSTLRDLYRGARLFVFPSLYEGFGLPPLEAMSWGVPVICSNAASLPEVVGDAAALFDPRDAGALERLILDLWQDPAKRQDLSRRGKLQAAKFSWKKCADETTKILLGVA